MSASPSHLNAFLASVDLLQGLDELTLVDLGARLECVQLRAGEPLIRYGARPDAAYIVKSGMLAATAPGSHDEPRFLATLSPGESVGGWELTTGDTAFADIVGLTDCTLLRFSRAGLDEVLRLHPQAAAPITTAVTIQVRRWRLRVALHVSQVFGELDEVALRELANELELVTVAGGEVLFRCGDEGDALYVVITGRVRVLVPAPGGEERVISELGIGQIFGEMSLISGEARSATIHAVRDTQLARLSRERYEHFVSRHPRAALQIVARTMALRLNERNRGVAGQYHSPTTFAVVPAGPDVSLTEFAERLARTFGQHGSALHLNSRKVETALGTPGISQAAESDQYDLRLVEWLGNQETAHNFLVFEVDHALTRWTRRCLRQADHLLIVGRAGSVATPGEIESWAMGALASSNRSTRSLVLLQSDAAPMHTLDWMRERTVDRHYHLRPHVQGDWDRLARLLLGRAFGLTLGGGFARGLVHIGVLRALREAGVAVDVIGGNSMGALIAAQWALGWDEETIVRRTVPGCAACIGGMTLPLVAFKSGDRFSRLVDEFFADTRIEDLPLPYFCVSANLNRAELKVHTEGLLRKAVLASTRVPGVFPPIVYDGELHVDGGVLDNVPVDVMRSVVKSGCVMGVDAVPSRVFNPVADYGVALSGWRAIWSRVNPLAGKRRWVPNILLIMLRTIEFGGITHNRSAASSADLYLHPPLQQFKPTDFARCEQIIDVGYHSAREMLESWQAAKGAKP